MYMQHQKLKHTYRDKPNGKKREAKKLAKKLSFGEFQNEFY